MLILEDDLHVGKIMKLIAETSGLDVRVLSASNLFLTAVAEWNPTHIALDLVMPDIDGVQILTELASRHCTARIIITSGMGTRVLDAAGRAGNESGLHIAGVLAKPFSAAEMRALLFDAPGEATVDDTPVPVQIGGEPGYLFDPPETEVRRALTQREFKLVYEPRIECDTGRLNGFEALVRWAHPRLGIVMPERFLPILARHGLTDSLNDTVLDQALSWFSGYPAEAILAINLEARAFKDPLFLERVIARCVNLGVEPHNVMFELTETNTLADAAESRDSMIRVRQEGFLLSIDDFGTGYSSLLQLVKLPFSEIKVDKSFVMASKQSMRSRLVVKSIVDLGRSLGLKSSAEGVEDEETLDYLRQIGCDIAQGYGIARPMDAYALEEWISGRPG